GIGLNVSDAEKYLSRLGSGITGLMRREALGNPQVDEGGLIGQFGIGLLSAFLLSDEISVESLKADGQSEPIHWVA
ncbi:MAG: molecular chaperone HtpG, partial [Planctomycetia bacterium]|nr:molecular chaperone HtpG [Planctomycetia bacterium]